MRVVRVLSFIVTSTTITFGSARCAASHVVVTTIESVDGVAALGRADACAQAACGSRPSVARSASVVRWDERIIINSQECPERLQETYAASAPAKSGGNAIRRVAAAMLVPALDEGSVLTSAGIASGIDLCLHVVRLDYGAAVANAVARRMVVAPHRSGGQAQFVPQSLPEKTDRPLGETRRWMQQHLREPLSLLQLAAHAGMSTRSFSRHFHAETGTTPLQWLLRQRIDRARLALEESDQTIERIADACGFGSAVSLRVHFRRELRTSPLAYRRTFRKVAATA